MKSLLSQMLTAMLCSASQSPLAVRAYGWVMLDEGKANTGGAYDFVVPINPNLEELRGKESGEVRRLLLRQC